MRSSSFAVLLLFMPTLALAAEPAPSTPQLIAHRGLLLHAPENTLAAFASCLELRLGFEVDVRRSKDGHLVVLHDAELNRTTNGKGKVSELTLTQLRELDAGLWFDPAFAGQRVPTLDEVFALLKARGSDRMLVAVDIKIDDEKVEADVVALAMKHGVLPRLLMIGTTIDSPSVRRRFLAADPATPTAVLAQTVDDLPAALTDRDARWAYLRFVPTAEQVKDAHKARKKVIVVGVSVAGQAPENWQKVREAGADAMLTDYPLECRQRWRLGR
jgi:glycerophosphoryl diester phosphodiesterase